MQGPRTLFRSLLSMRLLGSILILMALAVLLGSLAAARSLTTFNSTWELVDALAVLEGPVSVQLRQMQINELSYAFALDYETGTPDGQAARNADRIDQLLAELVAAGHLTTEAGYLPEDVSLFDDFRSLLAQHRQTWESVVQTYEADDPEAALDGLEAMQEEHEELQAMLAELLARVEADRLAAAQALPQDAALAMRGISIALVALLILALWGYRAIARLALPVVDLTNVVVAIGGDQYRPELLAQERNLGGPTGLMARALDAFAQAIEQRDATLKQEIDGLRERLRESRRRRLKIAHPDGSEGTI